MFSIAQQTYIPWTVTGAAEAGTAADGPYLSMRLPRRPIFSVVLLLPLAIN